MLPNSVKLLECCYITRIPLHYGISLPEFYHIMLLEFCYISGIWLYYRITFCYQNSNTFYNLTRIPLHYQKFLYNWNFITLHYQNSITALGFYDSALPKQLCQANKEYISHCICEKIGPLDLSSWQPKQAQFTWVHSWKLLLWIDLLSCYSLILVYTWIYKYVYENMGMETFTINSCQVSDTWNFEYCKVAFSLPR